MKKKREPQEDTSPTERRVRELMGKKPVRRVPPGPKLNTQTFSEMEKLSVQLDLQAGVKKAMVARKYGLSMRELNKISSEELNMTSGMKHRLEATATRLVQHANKFFDAIDDDKIADASLSQLSLAGAIAIDKAVQVDKHLHGTEDKATNLVLEFGSREQLERAIIKKFKDNPLFKAMAARDVTKEASLVSDEPIVGGGKQKQLSLFSGTEESQIQIGVEEGQHVQPGTPGAPIDFGSKSVFTPGLLREKKIPREQVIEDARIENEIDSAWTPVTGDQEEEKK
jgi:hypothetical protein